LNQLEKTGFYERSKKNVFRSALHEKPGFLTKILCLSLEVDQETRSLGGDIQLLS
jgi:hypothetical protein